MFGLGVPELLLILVIALVVFGPGKLPSIGAALGKSMREFKDAVNAVETIEPVEAKKGTTEPEKTEKKRTDGECGPQSMTFAEHLGELRTRLIRCLLGLAVGGALSFWQIDRIVAFLTAPVPQLYVMKPAEAFMIYVKIALWSGAILASPLLAWEFWAFLVPAFTEREKRTLLLFVPSSVLLFLAGLVFSYRLILPQGLQFLLAFSQGAVQPLWSLESYLDFVVLMVLPVGLFFNLPLVLLLLAKLGLVTSDGLKKARRYVIVLAFIVAAVITPTTDMVSQTLLALPLLLLYEISLVLIRVFLKRQGRRRELFPSTPTYGIISTDFQNPETIPYILCK